ncbi:hypothetical protein TrVE_jg11921 [Triparma verrucosa]|uniref:DNA-directed RNA polymerases I, II, and III subunit RPABC1 n=2 Tax=Triparma TaxID=722752 RepID=A0A9W7BJV1_9STRA|nr:hypothetical protein TrVE_jg11921 [Triparma verrucosa]GMH92531.1 hypothetical protein TrST_g7247 [Triparma strigata]
MSAMVDSPPPVPASSSPEVQLTPSTSKLFRCYKVITNMLQKRKYAVLPEAVKMTPASFVSRFGVNPDRSSMTIMVEKLDGSGQKLMVFFPEEEKVGVKPIKLYTDYMKQSDAKNAIMVLRQGITPFAKQAVAELSSECTIEHFREAELLIDITEHQLVPEHQVLTAGEKKDLLKRYRLKEGQLPRIQQTDPVARYYGMKRGEVVKIIRPSETAGRYVTYRVCM